MMMMMMMMMILRMGAGEGGGGRLVVSDGFLMSLLGRLVWHGTYGTLSGFTSCATV